MRGWILLILLCTAGRDIRAQAHEQVVTQGKHLRDPVEHPGRAHTHRVPGGQLHPDTWHSLEEALSLAEKQQQPVFLYVHAPWCAPCLRLERDVLPRLSYRSVIKAAVDLSDRPEPGFADDAIERIRSHGLDIPPSFALIEPDGDVKASITGFRDAPELALFLSLAEMR